MTSGPSATVLLDLAAAIEIPVAGTLSQVLYRANAIRATRALAKRQRTFFRRDPRVRWVPWSPDPGERIEAAIRLVGEGAT